MLDNDITIEAMAQHISAGDAQPLLPEGTPGPVRYQGHWWDARSGEQHYHRVTDAHTIAQRDRQAAAHGDTLRRLSAAIGGTGQP